MTSTLQRTLYNSTYRPRLNLSLGQFSRSNFYRRSSIHFFQSPPRAMPTYPGSCYCRDIEYELSLASPDDARTSLCHCKSCKKAFGTNYGLTAKIPKDALRLIKGAPKEHVADNGSGSLIHREFCSNCGSFICEYGDAVKDQFRYLCVGSLDDPEALPPKGEFFCSSRANWMPEIPGRSSMSFSAMCMVANELRRVS
ncbi:Mss4-like protein [Aspergillus minisclerotigenes]|uniref:Mss4-like protein n=1 Tax=Aspergillus minisclerotigenes TaxID=656917 RepID=A0A5N6JAQ4_9EURO|nr:Mss4-like protein [Aspergillus minisclerotigenes]